MNQTPSKAAQAAFNAFKKVCGLTPGQDGLTHPLITLTHDENLLLWQIENELSLIAKIAEPFDKNNAALAQRLRFTANYLNQLMDNIKKINGLDENHEAVKLLRETSSHIVALQHQQHDALQKVLEVMTKLETIAKLSSNQQNQLNKLQLQVVKIFNAENLAPEEKLDAIKTTIEKAHTAVAGRSTLRLFGPKNLLEESLSQIIASMPTIQISRPTQSGR